MHYSVKFAAALLGTTALALGAMPVAYATDFGPATGGAGTGTPTVVTTPGSTSISWSNKNVTWSFGTGSLAGLTSGTSKINGTLTFGSTVGSVVNESVPSFLFNITPPTIPGNPSNNTYTFTVTQVTTVSYSYNPLSSGSLSLYILGTMGGGTATGTATSLTLTANDTSGGPWTDSFTLANPPAPPPSVPEPASLALLGTGLIGLRTLRRRRK